MRVEDSGPDGATVALVAQGVDDIERTIRPAETASPQAQRTAGTLTMLRTFPPRLRAILLQRLPFGPRVAAAPWWYRVGLDAAWAPNTHLANRDLLTKFCVTRH
jgi:hypothetical protein